MRTGRGLPCHARTLLQTSYFGCDKSEENGISAQFRYCPWLLWIWFSRNTKTKRDRPLCSVKFTVNRVISQNVEKDSEPDIFGYIIRTFQRFLLQLQSSFQATLCVCDSTNTLLQPTLSLESVYPSKKTANFGGFLFIVLLLSEKYFLLSWNLCMALRGPSSRPCLLQGRVNRI